MPRHAPGMCTDPANRTLLILATGTLPSVGFERTHDQEKCQQDATANARRPSRLHSHAIAPAWLRSTLRRARHEYISHTSLESPSISFRFGGCVCRVNRCCHDAFITGYPSAIDARGGRISRGVPRQFLLLAQLSPSRLSLPARRGRHVLLHPFRLVRDRSGQYARWLDAPRFYLPWR